MLFFRCETHVAGVVVAHTCFAVGTISIGCGVLRYRNHLSTKKTRGCRNSGVNALGDRSSKFRVTAELLAQADEEQAADDCVEVLLHVALRGQRILCVKCHPFCAVGWPGGPTLICQNE